MASVPSLHPPHGPRVLHVAHGIPDFALAERPGSPPWRRFLEGIDLEAYEALIVISAHGTSRQRAVLKSGRDEPRLLHDYRGFDRRLSDLSLVVPAAKTALRHRLLDELRILDLPIEDAPDAGLDHGVWVPIIGGFGSHPRCPLFALDLPLQVPLARLKEWGENLAELTPRILWLTSGGIVHNLAALSWDDPQGPPYDWAREFWNRVEALAQRGDFEPLLRPWELPGGALSVPTREHYAPFILATGLAKGPLLTLAEGFAYRCLSLELLADQRPHRTDDAALAARSRIPSTIE